VVACQSKCTSDLTAPVTYIVKALTSMRASLQSQRGEIATTCGRRHRPPNNDGASRLVDFAQTVAGIATNDSSRLMLNKSNTRRVYRGTR